jgi:hypothetical protein
MRPEWGRFSIGRNSNIKSFYCATIYGEIGGERHESKGLFVYC